MVPRFRLLAALPAFILVAFITLSAGTAVSPGRAFAAGEPLVPGSSAIVRADGGCLNVRATPSLVGRSLICLAEGTTVVVLPSVQTADGLRWQLINTGAITGWAADQFLAPYTGSTPAVGASCSLKPTSYKPGLTGFVPTTDGTGMVVWGGGTLSGVQTNALTKGCTPKAVWTSRADGELVGYLYGAPDFVNGAWRSAFPDGWLSGGRVLMIVCEDPKNGTVSAAAVMMPGGIASTAPAPTVSGSAKAPEVTARAVAVIDDASGALIYGKAAHDRLAPASLTKVATAILAIEGMEPTAVITTDVDSRTMIESSVMGLIPGDCFTVGDLLYGLMLPSGNDVALAFARYEAGSDAAFVQQMNVLVKRLGLTDTTFTDPHGLDDPAHKSSAYDIAMLSRYGMSLPRFRQVVNTKAYTARGTRTLSMYNTNTLLTTYAGADGVKTGFTDDAGRTIAITATKNGHRLYVVLLNDNNRDADAAALLDWAFANYRWP